MSKARVIAFYLPQFHPVEVNDKYWGKGFTEWTNVAKAKPLFRGHIQPNIPADLGFYDLRLDDIREEQAKMAKKYDIEGFCYWYYWFGNGEKVLDMPINRVVQTGKPDFPFCLGWANHDWSNKTWTKTSSHQKDITFLKQKYLGKKDYKLFFDEILPMLKDNRYIKVENKPLFYIYDPDSIPDTKEFIEYWNQLAKINGLNGIYFVCRADSLGKAPVVNNKKFMNSTSERYERYFDLGYDAINSYNFRKAEIFATGYATKLRRAIQRKIFGYALNKHDYRKVMNYYYTDDEKKENIIPTIMPRRDRTPRAGRNGLIYINSSPLNFEKAVSKAIECIKNKPNEKKIIFLDSWNEWGEGSYMEPDLKFGYEYLEALKRCNEE